MFVLALTLVVIGSNSSIHAQEVKKTPVAYFNPDWSPDGKQIAFESTRDGKSAIYVMQADGTNLRKLTNAEAHDEEPRWSPDGKRIIFISQRDKHLQLYTMNADGSDQRRFTNGDDIDYQPVFSPKGDRVAFISRHEQPSVVHAIYTIGADGANRTLLSDQSANDTDPRWSPDGKKILFVRTAIVKKYYRDLSAEDKTAMKSSKEIFIMNRDGSGVRNLTNSQGRDCCAHWSRDGKTIYFLSERDGSPQIYAMKADGTNARKIADGSVVTDPDISPNGKYFVYTREVNGKWGVYLYNIEGRSERLLIGG
jgi:Tol biopolymer transport system component